jgi:hypothetical protein
MAKIPQPLPKNVSHAQIISGTYCVKELTHKKERVCRLPKKRAAANVNGISGMNHTQTAHMLGVN